MWQRFVVAIALTMSASLSLSHESLYGDNLSDDKANRTDQSHEVISELLSGDDFRRYVTQYVDAEDTWSQAMRTFGSLDSFMREFMTTMARHGALERGDTVPEFEHSISGQKWRAYRETLTTNNEVSVWSELVKMTEFVHADAHRTLVRALVYDVEAFAREVDLTEFVEAQTLPDRPGTASSVPALPLTTLDEFREVVWSYRAERRHWHSAMQQALAFAHMLDDLLTQWVAYGAEHKDHNCRPAEGAYYQRGGAWADYVDKVVGCTDSHWRELVQEAGVMHEHVHQMLHLMTNYRDWSVPTSLHLPALPSFSQQPSLSRQPALSQQ